MSPLRIPSVVAVLTLLIAGTAQAGSLSHDIKSALDKPQLAGAVVGVEVADMKTGQILYAQNGATRVMPASNRKLFTSAAALEILGDGYRFKTQVFAEARPDANGVIAGELYLKGGGDSLLSPDDLDQFAQSLVKLGVKRITGDVIGDGSFFTGSVYPNGWAVSYLSDYY